MPESRYELNAPDVVEESIDGEALIVNLKTGLYYSARGSGDLVWRLALAGYTAGEATAAMIAPETSREGVDSHVARFFGDLLTEELVRPREDRPVRPVEVQPGGAFDNPTLEKFSDLQELLVLDPVHDVTEEGWPHARPDLAAERSGR